MDDDELTTLQSSDRPKALKEVKVTAMTELLPLLPLLPRMTGEKPARTELLVQVMPAA